MCVARPLPRMEDVSGTCFICLEECPKLRICGCHDMPCHSSCQQRLVLARGNATCAVCHQTYSNVHATPVCLCPPKLRWAGVFLCFICLMGNGLLVLYSAHPTAWYLLAEGVVMISTSATGICMLVKLARQTTSWTVEASCRWTLPMCRISDRGVTTSTVN